MATKSFDFADYFRSSFAEKLISNPDSIENHSTPATRLLEKKREMIELEQVLASQKEEFQMKMESLAYRKDELEKKELRLRESLLKFDKFLEENDRKKRRAMKKANDERNMKDEKVSEIKLLQGDAATLQKALDKQRLKLEKHMLFQQYMERVVERGTDFTEIRDIIGRYDTLTSNLNELLLRDNAVLDDLEEHKQTLYKIQQQGSNDAMLMTNDIAKRQLSKEEITSVRVKWDSLWTHIQNTAARNVLLLGRVRMATENIYHQIYKQMKMKPEPDIGIDAQMDKIKLYVADLTDIINETNKKATVFDRLS